MAKPRQRVIRASEIGEYVFCSRAWWLHFVEKFEPEHPERLQQGTRLHEYHERAVRGSNTLLYVAVLLVVAAVLLFFVGRAW